MPTNVTVLKGSYINQNASPIEGGALMPTKILVWNIQKFWINKFNDPSMKRGKNTGGLTKNAASTQRKVLLGSILQATDPDILAVIEVSSGDTYPIFTGEAHRRHERMCRHAGVSARDARGAGLETRPSAAARTWPHCRVDGRLL